MGAERQDDHAAARAYFGRSLALHRELGDRTHEVINLFNLGNVAFKQGDHPGARDYFTEALTLVLRMGESRSRRIVAFLLDGVALLAQAGGRHERAVCLLGACEALRVAIGIPRLPEEREDHENLVADLRSALGEEAFMTAWSQGQALTLEEAIACALEFKERT